MRDVRIQKVLAEQGICSRRAAEQLIREGRVKLNGRPVTVGDKMDTLKDLLADRRSMCRRSRRNIII